MWRRLVLFAAAVMIAAAAGLLMPQDWLAPCLQHGGYYFVLSAFVLWVVWLVRKIGGRLQPLLRRHCPALLLCLALCTLVFVTAPPRFKILADETNLVGTSMSMHQARRAAVPMQGLALDYTDAAYSYHVDKRPLFYPLVLSLFHGLLGYAPRNAFVANFVLALAALLLFYGMVSRLLGRFWGRVSVLLLAGLPGFVFWTTSGGFETLNLFCVIFVFWMFAEVLRDRRVLDVELLLLSLLLLAQCRYESMVFGAVVLFTLPELLSRPLMRRYSWVMPVLPLLSLPVLWQRRLHLNTTEPVRMGVELYERAGRNFSFESFWNHLEQNIFVLSGLDPRFGLAPLVSCAAVIGGYFMVRSRLRSRHAADLPGARFYLAGAIGFWLLLIIYCAYYWGNLTLPMSNRLSLVLLPFVCFAAVFGLRQLVGEATAGMRRVLYVLLAFHVIFYWSMASQQHLVRNISLSYEYERVTAYLKERFDSGNENLLVIAELPNLYVVQGWGAVTFAYAARNAEQLAYHSSTYFDAVVALQRYDPRSGRLNAATRLPDGYALRTLHHVRVSPATAIRVSLLERFEAEDS